MGHARNYLTSDVIRRVLEDYFGYNIHFVMNVTDVDDKIIVKARRAHHLQRFRGSSPPPDEVTVDPSTHCEHGTVAGRAWMHALQTHGLTLHCKTSAAAPWDLTACCALYPAAGAGSGPEGTSERPAGAAANSAAV